MFILFIYLNINSLSPDSSFLDQVMTSPVLFEKHRKQALDCLPDLQTQQDVQNYILTNFPHGRFLKKLSPLTTPPLFNSQEREDIKRHILSSYCVYDNPLKKHIAIIGAGPVGLLCAIEFGLLGHQVTLIEKRDSYSRERLFWTFQSSASDIFKRFLPSHLEHKVTDTLCIKDFEKWMFSVFEAIQKMNPHVSFFKGSFTDYRVLRNKQVGLFFFSSNRQKTLIVDCLFGCDGAHSAVREKLQKNGFYTNTRSVSDKVKYVTGTLLLTHASKNYLNVRTVFRGKKHQFIYVTTESTFYQGGLNQTDDPHLCNHCIPIHVYGQYQSQNYHYNHNFETFCFDTHPVYLIGDSLSAYSLGTSFFIHASELYRNILKINHLIESKQYQRLTLLMQADTLLPYASSFENFFVNHMADMLHLKLHSLRKEVFVSEFTLRLILANSSHRHFFIDNPIFVTPIGEISIVQLLHSLSLDTKWLFRINEILYILINKRVSFGLVCFSFVSEFIENEKTDIFKDYLPFINTPTLITKKYETPPFNHNKSRQILITYERIKQKIENFFSIPEQPFIQTSQMNLTTLFA